MSRIIIVLFAFIVACNAIFPRTDCSCTCKDGKTCVKAVPNYLELKTQECQCQDGTCPDGLEFNGKLWFSCENSNLPSVMLHAFL